MARMEASALIGGGHVASGKAGNGVGAGLSLGVAWMPPGQAWHDSKSLVYVGLSGVRGMADLRLPGTAGTVDLDRYGVELAYMLMLPASGGTRFLVPSVRAGLGKTHLGRGGLFSEPGARGTVTLDRLRGPAWWVGAELNVWGVLPVSGIGYRYVHAGNLTGWAGSTDPISSAHRFSKPLRGHEIMVTLDLTAPLLFALRSGAGL